MKPEFIRCEFCKVEIPSETCKLAAHTTTIDGKEYTFCCVSCAKRYEKRQVRTEKKKSK